MGCCFFLFSPIFLCARWLPPPLAPCRSLTSLPQPFLCRVRSSVLVLPCHMCRLWLWGVRKWLLLRVIHGYVVCMPIWSGTEALKMLSNFRSYWWITEVSEQAWISSLIPICWCQSITKAIPPAYIIKATTLPPWAGATPPQTSANAPVPGPGPKGSAAAAWALLPAESRHLPAAQTEFREGKSYCLSAQSCFNLTETSGWKGD